MAKMVQIRNVPDTLHRTLKVRAADAGQTLSDYLQAGDLAAIVRASNGRLHSLTTDRGALRGGA